MSDKDSIDSPSRERLLIVTGRLAEGMVRHVAEEIRRDTSIAAEVHVVGISVAALMHVDWLRRKLTMPGDFDRVILPGWCRGDLSVLEQEHGIPFERGPKEIAELPARLGGKSRPAPDLSTYDIEIIAEINHAPVMSDHDIVSMANHYRENGADLIDIGCIPGSSWSRIGDVVRLLRADGFRISVDSFDQKEVEQAVAAGAELVLSCNQSNVEWASRLDAELVVIPDTPSDLDSMAKTVDELDQHNARYRLDPILEPIGFKFAASLHRYYQTRTRFPDAAMMMGVGNLTEMTEVDSAGVNFLLAAICQELNIFSVLATEVINWGRSAVREFDIARRVVKYAVDNSRLPKRVSGDLVMLRDEKLFELGDAALVSLAAELKDASYRVFVEGGEIHVMNRDGYWRGTDAFELFDRFSAGNQTLDPAHAFYLGYELCKAVTALSLGKQYRQDQALQWGFLTVPEASAHERRRAEKGTTDSPSNEPRATGNGGTS